MSLPGAELGRREDTRGSGRLFEGTIFAALAIWSLIPNALLLAWGGVWNGSSALNVADQMQYLSFIRDAGTHVLFANRFDVVHDPHLFFHPFFALSGLVWKLGASIQVSLLIWKPVAVLVLYAGFRAYVRRLLGPDRLAMATALALALFAATPAMALTDWLGASQRLNFGTSVMGLETYAASYTWGAGPGVLSVALMPLFLLAVERLLDPARRADGRSARWYAIWAGIAGMFCAWLHPWQGITLLVILAGLVVWDRFARRLLVLAIPIVLTTAPLAYMWVLSHTNSSWKFVSQPNHFSHFGWWLVLGVAPAVLALPAYRARDLDVQQRIVRIWPIAALLVYFGLHRSWFYHALVGTSLPLAVLMVVSWRDFRLPRSIAVAAMLIAVVPGMVYAVDKFQESRELHFFTPDERRALTFMDNSRRAGAVLAPVAPLGQAAPAFTGRNTYVGHYEWTPGYDARRLAAEALFDGSLSRPRARLVVRQSRATFLASDCKSRVDLAPVLRPGLRRVIRFGCATIYEVDPAAFVANG